MLPIIVPGTSQRGKVRDRESSELPIDRDHLFCGWLYRNGDKQGDTMPCAPHRYIQLPNYPGLGGEKLVQQGFDRLLEWETYTSTHAPCTCTRHFTGQGSGKMRRKEREGPAENNGVPLHELFLKAQ